MVTLLSLMNKSNLFLNSLLRQTKKANEIIVVDAGSTDNTIKKIKSFKKVRLVISKGASIAKGRNLAIENAKSKVIAMTDAGCVCDKNWIRRITLPFEKNESDVVAGYYLMSGDTNFQKALKPYLGIIPSKFDKETFLPSTRSIVFKKSVWKKIKFNEKFDRAGEDTEFNIQLLKYKIRIKRVKNAVVSWEVPSSLIEASRKFYYYARGDAQGGNFTSRHNLKVMTIFGRYFIFYFIPPLFFVHLIWPIWKFRDLKFNWSSRLWTVIIQLVSDFSVMYGFLNGILKINN